MKPKSRRFSFLSPLFAASSLAVLSNANAEILSFDGNVASGVTTHTINATDWADYVGGSGTFNSANEWGRLFWRGSAGDGQYMHFNLSSLEGLTLVAPVTVTLQNANPTWGGGVDGSYIATADGAWTATGGTAIPGATAISNAVNATGSYGAGQSVSWGIGSTTFQGFLDTPSSLSNGLAIIGGSGSQLHFSGPTNPYLTAQTGTISSSPGMIIADTGASLWNVSNYSYVASNAYSPTINTLTISGEILAGTSGAGSLTINNGGTVVVNQAGAANYVWSLDGTTINAGGRLTINGHSNLHNLTLAGGELASTGTDGTYGGWGLPDPTIVTGATTSTISAQQITIGSGVFDVATDSTLNFTGSTRGTSNSLTKNGAGTMRFTGYQNYTGGTTINEGTLEVAGQNSGYGWLRGAVTINAGGTLAFTGGDGTGFGWNNPVTSLNINGGTFSAGSTHIGFGSAMALTLSNGGTISGNGQWNGDGLLTFSSSGDSTNTLNGNWNLRSDNGAVHTFSVGNGSSNVDLQVNANLGDQYPEVWWTSAGIVTKTGDGTMVLSGDNSYNGQTRVNAGTLIATSNTALGPGGWDGGTMTWVYDGATLGLQGGISLSEHMHIFGAGVNGQGAIRSISGNNSLPLTFGNSGSGPGISIDSNTTIGVDADTLTSTGFYQDGGSWSLTKVGAGTLKFTQPSEYTGGTIVNSGTLELNGASGGRGLIRGALTVNPGTVVNLTGGDGTGFGYSDSNKITSLTINEGSVNSAGTCHIWNLSGGLNMTGGSLASNGGVSDPNALQLEWLNTAVTTNASATTSNIGGRIRIRGDGGYLAIPFNVADGEAATDLLVSAAITEASSGRGITKSGAGTMKLTGQNTYTGTTTVSEGVLSLDAPNTLNDTSSVDIAAGAVMDLNYEGNEVIGSLSIDGSGPLAPGVYNANDPTYGAFFTGTGSLIIPSSNGTWTSLEDGDWGVATNWDGSNIAIGYDATATFNAETGVTVNVDADRKIGSLLFDVSDYTLSGTGLLILDSSSTPVISVATNRTATISSNLAGSLGMEKTGEGTLLLQGVKSYTGGTTVTSGTLELNGSTGGNSIVRGSLTVAPGATVAITGGDGSGFGWNNPVNSINVDGGTLNASNSSHIGFGVSASLNLSNGSNVLGSWQWNGDALLSVSTYGDSTNSISGSLVLRSDAGTSHSFFVDDGAASNDLAINANLSDQWPEYPAVPASGLTKNGPGRMILNGTNTYDGNTIVNEGTLEVSATSSLQFRPTTNGASNKVTGSASASLQYLGAVYLDLRVANATAGNAWNLIEVSSFVENAPVVEPTAVGSSLGDFTEVSAGTWELAVEGAKWVFTEADGNLAYQSLATDFETWLTDNGVVGGENDDDDSDGMTNYQEYTFGLNPTSGSSQNPIAVPLDHESGTFSYTRRQQSLTGLTYTVWYSTDLNTWNEDNTAQQGTPLLEGSVETVPVTVTPSLLANPQLFLRVQAQ